MTDGAGFDPALGEGLTRLEYLRLLRLGYIRNMHSDAMPLDLWQELETLEEIERVRVELERVAAEDRRRLERQIERERLAKEWERKSQPEGALEEHWVSQRQLGKTAAAEAWAKKYGVPLPEIVEASETEEEMREAIRNLQDNLRKARKGPRGGTRPGGATKRD